MKRSEAKGVSRRDFSKWLGAGLLVSVVAPPSVAEALMQNRRRSSSPISSRVHLAEDGTITVMTGKVEMGQGARAQITQAAAEELGVEPGDIELVMGDTSLCPNDGGTWGSQTTPRTIPSVRFACAATAGLLADFRASKGDESLGYGDLAAAANSGLDQDVPSNVSVTAVNDWKVLGQSLRRPNGQAIVRGEHQYPSDIVRPGMLYGKILRPPSYDAELISIDLDAARQIDGAEVFRDGNFVGVGAPRTYLAKQAIAALAETAEWSTPDHPASSDNLYEHLQSTARNVSSTDEYEAAAQGAAATLEARYNFPYAAHTPLEPRAAVAEFDGDGSLTIWAGSQNPFGMQGAVANVVNLPAERVRVVVPDFGGGFGGKSSSEWAEEAARLAKAFGKPVAIRWTREEEFCFAYHRPAATMDCRAALDGEGNLQSYYFVSANPGGSGVRTPYNSTGHSTSTDVAADAPLRQGSYRALGSTANNFARESFIDELAHAAKHDPLEWRLRHLESDRLKRVLEAAAKGGQWISHLEADLAEGTGVGIACGTEKNSFVAACVWVTADVENKTFQIDRIFQAYDCGPVMNPDNCRAQVVGAILQGLGPAVTGEELLFASGMVSNPRLAEYKVPRFADVPPTIEVELINDPEVEAVGAGETPLVALAPAIGNALFMATGQRLRQLPFKLS